MIEELSRTRDYARMSKYAESTVPHEMRPDQIGARLKLIRESHGLKPAQIADILGIERTYWSRFEGGKRVISNEVAYLLTQKFYVTLDFLLLNKWENLPLEVAERMRSYQSDNR